MSFEQNKSVIVDIQYLPGNFNQIFAKEVVFLFANSTSPIQFLFQSPYSVLELDRRSFWQCKFLYENINGLKWTDGEIEYSKLNHILQTIANYTIIVRGNQKKNFLKKFLPKSKIIDIDMGSSLKNFKNFSHNCQIHNSHYKRCGVNIVFKILFFMEKYNKFV